MAMDPTTTTAPPSAPRTIPESDAHTSPRSASATTNTTCTNKPMGFLAYANDGALKRHRPPTAHLSLKQEPRPGAAHVRPVRMVAVSYKECMRNHAASIGCHALDGCCEFMPSPAAKPAEPTSLRCAACGCHRNFHRRDPDDPAPLDQKRRLPPPPLTSPPPPATSSFYSSAPHMLAALKKGLSGSPTPATAPTATNGGRRKFSSGGGSGKKRFRTKFSQEQKKKMYEFSERSGWKMQKIDKRVVDEFCNEVGVGKEVLKVWMHNNKNTFAKRENASGSDNNNNNNSSAVRSGEIVFGSGDKNGDHHGLFYCSSDGGGSGGADGGEKGEKMEMGGGGARSNGGDFVHFQVVSANGSSSSSG